MFIKNHSECSLLWECYILKRAWSPTPRSSRPKVNSAIFFCTPHANPLHYSFPLLFVSHSSMRGYQSFPKFQFSSPHEPCFICLLTGIPVSSCTSPSSTRCQAAFSTSKQDHVISTNPQWPPTAYRVESKVTGMAQRPSTLPSLGLYPHFLSLALTLASTLVLLWTTEWRKLFLQLFQLVPPNNI